MKAIWNVDSNIKETLSQNQNLIDTVPVANKFANMSIPESRFYIRK